MSAQVDALGRRTEMVYDARGNHMEADYPDGSSEITVYDAENRVVAKIDRDETLMCDGSRPKENPRLASRVSGRWRPKLDSNQRPPD